MKTAILTTMALTIGLQVAVGADWPQWQGPDRDATSQEEGLLQKWPADGPPLSWRVSGLGGGDSTPAVADGKIYGMSHRDGQEIVWALSEENGEELWAVSIGEATAQKMRQSQEGPGGTPTVDGDFLYVVGMGGTVARLRANDGAIEWTRSLTEDFGGMLPTWSYRESPLIDGNKLICTPGSNDAVIVALNKQNGQTIWQTPKPEKPAEPEAEAETPKEDNNSERGRNRRGGNRQKSAAAYSSPIVITVEGVRQYVQFTSEAVLGVSADNGQVLWTYAAPANHIGINCSTPVYQDGLVFAASAYGNGGGAVKLSKQSDGSFKAEEAYFTNRMQNHHGGVIVLDETLYGANGGNEGGFLACLDFQTGELLWRDREAPKGALLLADGRLYLRSEEGEMVLIEPSREELKVRGRFQQPDRSSSPAWAHPIIASGRLYIRDQGALFCYNVKAE